MFGCWIMINDNGSFLCIFFTVCFVVALSFILNGKQSSNRDQQLRPHCNDCRWGKRGFIDFLCRKKERCLTNSIMLIWCRTRLLDFWWLEWVMLICGERRITSSWIPVCSWNLNAFFAFDASLSEHGLCQSPVSWLTIFFGAFCIDLDILFEI